MLSSYCPCFCSYIVSIYIYTIYIQYSDYFPPSINFSLAHLFTIHKWILERNSHQKYIQTKIKTKKTQAADQNPVTQMLPMLFLDDSTDSSPLSYRSVARRKTDLMPTIPTSRDSNFGSRSSLYCHTPRTQGKQTIQIKNTNQLQYTSMQTTTYIIYIYII